MNDEAPNLIRGLHNIEDDSEFLEMLSYGQIYDKREPLVIKRINNLPQEKREQAERIRFRKSQIRMRITSYFKGGTSSNIGDE